MTLDDAAITEHAQEQMDRRGITTQQVRDVLRDPETIQPVREGRIVAQGMVTIGDARTAYLLRVFVDVDRSPPEVVTVYRTSKINNYRSCT